MFIQWSSYQNKAKEDILVSGIASRYYTQLEAWDYALKSEEYYHAYSLRLLWTKCDLIVNGRFNSKSHFDLRCLCVCSKQGCRLYRIEAILRLVTPVVSVSLRSSLLLIDAVNVFCADDAVDCWCLYASFFAACCFCCDWGGCSCRDNYIIWAME